MASFLFVSGAWADLYGFDHEIAVSDLRSMLEAAHPDDRGALTMLVSTNARSTPLDDQNQRRSSSVLNSGARRVADAGETTVAVTMRSAASRRLRSVSAEKALNSARATCASTV